MVLYGEVSLSFLIAGREDRMVLYGEVSLRL